MSDSIMSPFYKPRTFSTTSNGWKMTQQQNDQKKGQQGWDFDMSKKKAEDKKTSKVHTAIIEKILSNNHHLKPNTRKNTMASNAQTIRRSSPLIFKEKNAAFKPFKKRAYSFAPINCDKISDAKSSPDVKRKRERKALNKIKDPDIVE